MNGKIILGLMLLVALAQATECQEEHTMEFEFCFGSWGCVVGGCKDILLEYCDNVGYLDGEDSGLTGYQVCTKCGQCTYVEVYGCTDPEFNNYDATADHDDGSCSNQCQEGHTWEYQMCYGSWGCVLGGGCEDVPLEYCENVGYVDGEDSGLTGYQACTKCGQCTYAEVYGCTDPEFKNYDAAATQDDGSCSNQCQQAHTWQYEFCEMLGVCVPGGGCDKVPLGDCGKLGYVDGEDSGLTGYQACTKCGQCTAQAVPGCTDPEANNYDAAATQDDGSCSDAVQEVPGCTDTGADNYNVAATQDDGSCTYPVPGCTDTGADNYNAAATQDDGSCTYPVPGCTDAGADNYNSAATQDDGSCTYPSSCLDHSFACGSYCGEVGWQLTANGQTVCSAPADSQGVPSGDCCIDASTVYALQMSDSYGDGWNGGQLTIGTETFTLSSGASGSVENPTNVGCDMVAFSGAEVDMCGVCGGDGSSCGVVCMDYSFTCGSYCSEVGWLLKIGGSIICSGSEGVAGECCPEAIKSYTLQMSDSYGDGWNGGKLVIGDEEYTLSAGSSESVEIAATAAAPSNEATVITMATSLTIGDNDDADEAAGVAAGAFANSVGADSSAVSYNFVGRRVRRLLGQSLDLELSLTTTDSSLAESAFAAASSDDFSATMAAEMENVAAEMGVTVTVESLVAEAPTESTTVTGCPSLAKKECKADSSCFYHKQEDSCYDPTCSIMHSAQTCEVDNGLNCQWVKGDKLCREMPVGCPKFIKKKECKADDTCSWIVDSCVDKTPGCGGFNKKGQCIADDTCLWNSSINSCVNKPDGCGQHTTKKKCWEDSDLVCAWNFDIEKCQSGECAGMEKKECKGNKNKCTWNKDKDGVKTCSAV